MPLRNYSVDLRLERIWQKNLLKYEKIPSSEHFSLIRFGTLKKILIIYQRRVSTELIFEKLGFKELLGLKKMIGFVRTLKMSGWKVSVIIIFFQRVSNNRVEESSAFSLMSGNNELSSSFN